MKRILQVASHEFLSTVATKGFVIGIVLMPLVVLISILGIKLMVESEKAPRIVGEVAQVIREVRDRGVSVLLIEQNAALALELADYGYVMENGKIVLDGEPEELSGDPDFQEFYLGIGAEGRRSYADVKLYRRKKRWLS